MPDGVKPSVLLKAYGGSPPPFDQPGLPVSLLKSKVVVGCDGGDGRDGGAEGGDRGGGRDGGEKGSEGGEGGEGGESGGDGGSGDGGGNMHVSQLTMQLICIQPGLFSHAPMFAQRSHSLFVSAHGRSGGGEGGENSSQQPVQSQPRTSSSLHRSRPFRAPHVDEPHPMSQLGVLGGADCGVWTAKSRGSHCGGHATPRTRSSVLELRGGNLQLGVGVLS